MIILILLLLFLFTCIGAILWVCYDHSNTVNEIEKIHKERIREIIETGLDKIKKDI